MGSIRSTSGFTCFGFTCLLTLAIASHASAQQDWSHLHPPPVVVAPLPNDARQDAQAHRDPLAEGQTSDTSERSVLQVNHLEPIPQTSDADPIFYANELAPSAWRPPAHRTIEAPREPKRTSRHSTPSAPPSYAAGPHEPYPGYHFGPYQQSTIQPAYPASHANGHGQLQRSNHDGGSYHHGSLHHHPILPERPGVENDPKSAGPGHLGLGTHWIRAKTTMHPPIPGATVAPRWKTPYSYGHFGAEGKRTWTRQYGYRDRYLQWTLR